MAGVSSCDNASLSTTSVSGVGAEKLNNVAISGVSTGVKYAPQDYVAWIENSENGLHPH